MNIYKSGTKSFEEWCHASHHLKEFNDDEIPTSQNIDSNSSDDEDHKTSLRNNLIFLRSKNKSSHIQNKEEVILELSNPLHEEAKSPVLKARVQKSPCLSRKFSNVKRLNAEHSYKAAVESGTRILNKIDCNITYDNLGEKNDNIKLSESVENNFTQSPILKSKIHRKYNSNRFNIKSMPTKRKIDEIQITKIVDNANVLSCSSSQNIVESMNNNRSTQSDILSNHSLEIYESDIDIDIPNDIISTKLTRKDIEKKEEPVYVISNCLSPNINYYKQGSKSTTPSINTEESLEQSSILCKRKGSEWLKVLQETTPEKAEQFSNCQTDFTKLDFDSTKKKIKKNGFAYQLQKLIYFNQSNVTIWNHQMSLASTNNELCCSQSPNISNSHSLSQENALYPSTSSQSPLSAPLIRVKTKNRFSYRSLSSLFFKGDGEESDVKLKQIGKVSPLINCVRNLKDSLDINSNDSSITSRTNFTIPKKHICVKIIKIEWQTPIMISAICQEIDKCSLSYVNSNAVLNKSKKILGIFGRPEKKCEMKLEVGSTIKIFAPWQVLEIKSQPYTTLFTSYYFLMNIENNFEAQRKEKKLMKIASWDCACLAESHIIPSMCHGGCLNIFESYGETRTPKLNRSKQSEFNSVKDTSISCSPKCDRYWTILEAIEQCGGLPDIPVSLTIRIRRILKMRNNIDKNISHYTILGQDPSGTFAVLEIPNRPLKSTLKFLIEDGLNTTQTLTHLSVQQRIVNSQDPELFSLINSLQEAYKKAITNHPHILPLLKDQTQKPPQTFCYKFVASLGQTLDYKIVASEALNVVLPRWNLNQASVLESGKRGSIFVIILYYIHPNIYVKCKSDENTVHKLVVKGAKLFPEWINCDGTIMVRAIIQDVVSWRGTFVVDKFSLLERIEEVQVIMSDLLSIIPVLKKSSKASDVVVICGVIKGLNTDTAYIWDECSICGDSNFYTINISNIKCQSCNTEHISPVTKYSLQVDLLIKFVDDTEKIAVVTLFQSTIKSILKNIPTVNNRYGLDDILNAEVGPLICYVKSIEKRNGNKTLVLIELPY